MITRRRYKLLADFKKVSQFLVDIYNVGTLNSYLLQQFFEYAHTHPYFNYQSAHRFGIWEEKGEIIGLACYEMDLGDAFLVVKPGYNKLLFEMLEYVEKELSTIKDGKIILNVWITDKEKVKRDLLQNNGYKKEYKEIVTIFSYEKDFVEFDLPSDYSLFTLEEENDIKKIHDCLWKGFDHGPNPDDDYEGRLLMQSGPNFRKDLTTIIKAPDGEYACYAGMWFDTQNKYAYLEPLATVPEHRGKGLATIALTEGMKKTKALGAEYCFGGAPDFYKNIGFETVAYRERWQKILN
ncbi:GNAT family N-acetyltransferase [Halanaerobiaceae bacterium Z-7014]|uniref:GNAT family N-acetyltransferase n=1 Tax=Halonatronomonas betaini TaxID=2778430 RepID=A0A931F9V4_9FIRM|nr:GNAT family N-acetyltransferase [Halonatronomonas betaini]MBF8436904.1 GNAT family N-acetyltransferase [Halonatronomonas betaini]